MHLWALPAVTPAPGLRLELPLRSIERLKSSYTISVVVVIVAGSTGLYKQIECVAVFYDVLPDELVVRERLAHEEEALGVCGWRGVVYAIESVGRTARLYCAGGRRLLIVSVSVADEEVMVDSGGGTGKQLSLCLVAYALLQVMSRVCFRPTSTWEFDSPNGLLYHLRQDI
jgi:hypothetical protein